MLHIAVLEGEDNLNLNDIEKVIIDAVSTVCFAHHTILDFSSGCWIGPRHAV